MHGPELKVSHDNFWNQVPFKHVCARTHTHTHTHSVTRMLRNLCPSVRARTHTHTHTLSDKDAQVPVSLTAQSHTQPSVTRMLRNL